MSHTDKDRPYWVKLNDEGVVEHDHTFCFAYGGGTTRSRWGRPLFDEDGAPIMETVEDTEKASWYAKFGPRVIRHTRRVYFPLSMSESMLYTRNSFYDATYAETANPLWSEAQRLVAADRGDELIVTRTYQRQMREKIEYSIAQECTGDLPQGRSNKWAKDNEWRPCNLVMPAERSRYNCSCYMCEPGGIWAEKKSRSTKRNTLRKMAKAYDGSDDWDDEFEEEELHLSRPLRYVSQW